MDVSLIIRILMVIAQVIQELWEGPLGELIRDLMEKKEPIKV